MTAEGNSPQEKQSRWITTIRQPIEMMNAALKRGFPRLTCSIKLHDLEFAKRDIELIIRLSNFRTRECKWNEVRNTYLPFIERKLETHGLIYDPVEGIIVDKRGNTVTAVCAMDMEENENNDEDDIMDDVEMGTDGSGSDEESQSDQESESE
jgi:hypothetical protein